MGYVAEIEEVPNGTAHGDACTNNLLVRADSPDLILIDFGFWSTQPLGFDLGQLLIGDVQIGRRSAACLAEVENACFPAYIDGLRAEGCDVSDDIVRRGHALQMLIYAGLSAVPFDDLHSAPTPELHRVCAERALMAKFVLDLVDATDPARAADR